MRSNRRDFLKSVAGGAVGLLGGLGRAPGARAAGPVSAPGTSAPVDPCEPARRSRDLPPIDIVR